MQYIFPTTKKTRLVIFGTALIIIAFGFLTRTVSAATGINRTVQFQGRVVNKTTGTNVTDGTYTFVFSIYNASSGGSKLWGDETQNSIQVTSGIFTVALGSVRTFATDNLDFNQDNLWLNITFNGEAFGSRVRLTAVPYAFEAERVSGLTVTNNGGNTLNIAANKTFTVSNSLTFSGTDTTSFSFPSTSGGVVLTSTAPSQTVTSTQTTGTVLGISDSTALSGAIIGQAISLTGTGAQDQTGLKITLQNASGTNLNGIVVNDGSSDTFKVSKTGAITGLSLTLGTNPASSGTIAIPNNTYMNARNAANSGDINLIKVDGSNLVAFGANLAAFTLGGTVTGNSQTVSGLGAVSASSLALGTTPAAAGTLRLPNNTFITARNAANSADVNLIAIDGSNLVSFGANTAAFTLGGTISGNNQTISSIGNISANSSSNTVTGFGTIGTNATTAFTGSTLTLGASAASTGTIRLPNASWLIARNAANGADVNMIQVNSSDLVAFGANLAAFTLGGTVTGNSQTVSGLGAVSASSLALGTTPAAAGTLRLPNATYITVRNAANNGDVNMIQVDASNNVAFGANLAAFTLGGTVTGNSQNINAVAGLTINGGGSITSATSGTLSFGTSTNTTALTLGNATNTTTLTMNSGVTTGTTSTSGIVFNTASLTSGTGLQVTTGNPKANNNSGVLTSGKIINASSANHTYMSLDNRDLTIGGHKNNIAIPNVVKIFIYDTSRDTDGGRWTDGNRSQAASWYNETIDNTGDACVIDTNDRCGSQSFPQKAIIVASTTKIYIFDAKDNTLWMDFRKGSGATEQMIGPTTTSTVSSISAYNGKIYVGNSGATGYLYTINFIRDIAKRYNATDDYQGDKNIANRNTTVSWMAAAGQALAGNNINDLYVQIVNGKQYIAVAHAAAANGSVSVINETDQTTTKFGPAAAASVGASDVFITPAGSLYAAIGSSGGTNYALKVKHNMQNVAAGSNNALFDEVYLTTSTTVYGATTTDNNNDLTAGNWGSLVNGPAPVDTTFVPNSLFVTYGTSLVNGRSNTIYIGNNDNLMVIQEKQYDPSNGSVKYFNSSFITEELVGDFRGYLPLNGSAGVIANNTNITGATLKGNAFTVKNANGTGIAYGSGVRGTGITALDNTDDYICTGTTGTCADDADFDSAVASTGSFTIGAWVKRSATGTAADVIMAKWGNAAANQAYRLQFSATDIPTLEQGSGAATTTTTGAALTDTANWHFIVGVFDNVRNNQYLYIDGVKVGTTANANNTANSGVAYTIGADLSGAANAAANFFRGAIDEPFMMAEALSDAQVRQLYKVGYRASMNHTSDTLQKLNGTSSQVNAVAVDSEEGMVYAGTNNDGGVSVVGTDSDTIERTYTTSTTDDINSAFGSNIINSISVSQGFGGGTTLVAIGNNTSGGASTQIYVESSDTAIKDVLSASYNPFGNTLTQNNLNVDTIFRVTNPISSKTDNLAFSNTVWPAIVESFRVDGNGAAIQTVGGTLTNTGAATYNGLTFNAFGNSVTHTGTATTNLNLSSMTLPTLTQTSGTVTVNGENIVIPVSGAIVTGGTMSGLNIVGPTTSGPAAGTLNGIKIGNLTAAGAAAENALHIGQGWDNAIKVQATAAFTQASALTGLLLDYSTTYTAATGQNITGISILTPTVTATSATTYTGLTLGTAGAMTSNGGNATFNGLSITTPNITQTANTAAAIGLNLTMGTLTTGGSQSAIKITGSNSNAAGTQIGLDMSTALTAGAATEYAIRVAKGWDAALAFGALTANDNTTQAVIRFSTSGNAAGTCAAGTAQGLVFQDQAGTQIGHFCKDSTAQMDVFAATTTVGTDVAENYSDIHGDLKPGDIVSISAEGPVKAVVKSTKAYDVLAFGIVSTDPGVTLSGIAEADGSTDLINPTPIALTGRVPTHVSSENGEIHIGDYLTTSSTPGVAMKADKAGIVIGQALQNYSGNGVGTIEVFARTGYFNGIAMEGTDQLQPASSAVPLDGDKLINQLGLQISSSTTVDATGDATASISAQFSPQTTHTVNMSNLSGIEVATISGSFNVKGKSIFESIVQIVTDLITRNLEVQNLATFLGNVIFRGDVLFTGRPTFNSDSAGFAVIKKGGDRVDIVFEKEYTERPVVTASISLTEDSVATESAIMNQSVSFMVSRRSTKGFSIILDKKTDSDITFSWSALSVKDPHVFESRAIEVTPTSAPSQVLGASSQEKESVAPAPTESPVPSIVQTQEAGESASPSATSSP